VLALRVSLSFVVQGVFNASYQPSLYFCSGTGVSANVWFEDHKRVGHVF